ncbi:MAG: N-acetylneuraminate synthase family protein [Candidatus Omnitrophota bacterium]|nr:N-acetylneuraminate synthase family protein [Candidatus Omnitrophota bacterium]
MKFQTLFSKSKKNPVYIIAEIGGNFLTYKEGTKLIDAAKDVGVDCIKLQTYRAQTLVTKNALFDMKNTGKVSQYDYFKKYELSKELHKKIFDYAEFSGLDWFSTPSHQSDVDMLESLGAKAYKVGADDAVNIPFLRIIAKKKLPIFLSTGMCTLKEVRESVVAILREGNKKIVIMHTVSVYPTYPEQVNLNAIKTLQKEFPDFVIGYSDHTQSSLACIVSVVIGARVIEKHFTLDKKTKGPDHMLSADPSEMKYIVESIRTIEKMFGTGIKKPVEQELKNRTNNRKSIVAIRDIKKGEHFSIENLSFKRPGTGISPKYLSKLLGKEAKRDIREDELICREDLDGR